MDEPIQVGDVVSCTQACYSFEGLKPIWNRRMIIKHIEPGPQGLRWVKLEGIRFAYPDSCFTRDEFLTAVKRAKERT